MKYRFGFHLGNHNFKETDTIASADQTVVNEPKELTLHMGGEVKDIHLDQETVEILIEDKIHTGG